MQDRNSPPSPPGVLDTELTTLDDIEEIIDLDDSIENTNDSSSDNESDSTAEVKDDAVCVFRGHESKYTVFCCSLSKDSKLAATGDENDMAYIWNANTGECIFNTGTSHNDSVIFAQFNYNDKYIATADMRGKINLWRISDKSCVWQTTLTSDITWVQWHHSTDVLIAGVVTGEVYMVKTRKNDFLKVFAQGTGDRSETGIILPDGKRAAIGYGSGTIYVLDLKSNTVLSTTPHDQTRLRGHASGVIAIDCHMDNNLLISISLQSQTILSTAHNGKVICILQDLNKNGANSNTNNNVEAAAFCKDPTFPAAATGTIINNTEGKLYIWDISKQILRHEIKHDGGITKLVWTKTAILLTAGLDGKIRCFDARAGQYLRSFSGHRSALYDLCLSSDEKKALSVSDDSTARIFDISLVH
ncbi:hypothetical protein PUN28_005024 [Cardiocondyla obscurior]